ncbi:MAG TPA: response regulator [Prolixibacteraceae bacterium]|nr:response regulator [Prolixibacteraceae bacterium]
MKLLVVDDNPINQKFLYYSLRKYYEIETANNGLEAVEILEEQNFDVVLMDLSMPVMDGAEATSLIRKSIHFRNKYIPIIFVTTNDFEHERVRCLSKGGDAYLIKPVVVTELLSTISFHLNAKQDLVY